jgi:hypothetical protein
MASRGRATADQHADLIVGAVTKTWFFEKTRSDNRSPIVGGGARARTIAPARAGILLEGTGEDPRAYCPGICLANCRIRPPFKAPRYDLRGMTGTYGFAPKLTRLKPIARRLKADWSQPAMQ